MNGSFIDPSESGALVRLIEDSNNGKFFEPGNHFFIVTPTPEISVDQSLKMYDGIWLPVSVLRSIPLERFDIGSHNWRRVRIVSIPEGDEPDGNTHRVTFAFDTKIFANMQYVVYLAPNENDVKKGSVFSLAHCSDQISWYLELKWITSWLIDLFQELAPQPERLKLHKEDIELEIIKKSYYGHYLNILNLLVDSIQLPTIKIVSNSRKFFWRWWNVLLLTLLLSALGASLFFFYPFNKDKFSETIPKIIIISPVLIRKNTLTNY
ncbi:virulence factor SrfB [Gilliamella sp. B2776]|uniref:virulence factor SrfB n=1 Tax=Gilliamella sp. B3022 TaxID=2817969 RepID=UPI0027A45207|nr:MULTISPECIES: virulence factor SrfB [unclassified Gilliamella]WDM19890.1 virulence factor SrfB [Gilliamella sp. B3022]MCX8649763.1 virulence factor SrfB [Gilliamella sp. B2779]MCX8653726.1 virulence factor SrfB [Gilliamella sp. B2737]MCX8691536.1 virulence factor SrfB [Gilliamella sp. B2776]MCX8702694.1 virulence factor SrfB [Gilliamella sp. B2781]